MSQQKKARKKAKLSKECIEKNIDKIISISQKEGVVVDPLSISYLTTVYKCPYKGCSTEFEGRGLLKHLSTAHTAEEDLATSCPFCEKRMNSLFLLRHLENNHPELNVEGELNELSSSIDPKHKAIRDSISKISSKRTEVAAKLTVVLGSSIFMPSPSGISYTEFRASLRSKLIENTKAHAHLIFKFLARTTALEWGCLICADNAGLAFKNQISLRLHALFHLEKHVDEEHFDHLRDMITKEWSLLKQEIPTLPITKMRTRGELPVGRSFLSYSLLRSDDSVGQAMDVIDRCYVDGVAKAMRNALCLVCHSPFSVSLSQPLTTPTHFLIDSHRHLQAKGWSEFAEVQEIAEIRHEEEKEKDARSSLVCSSFYHVSDERLATPKKLFKWRCTLCSLDVAVFPSSVSLRFFALRHLEKEHPTVFNDAFYEHEWSVLQMETSLVSMRSFSQTAHIQMLGRPVDITDPSDFLFPFPHSLRVPSPEYYVCGHCFFVSTEAEIRDHLTGHGLVEDPSKSRIVLEDDGYQAVAIDERTIRRIRKGLSVPASILYGESTTRGGIEEKEGVRRIAEREVTPSPRSSTPGNGAMDFTALTDTPKSKYSLRVRRSARYVPLEEETTNNETMSSEESDSGLEKNYHMMSGDDDTMEETVEDTEDDEGGERPQSAGRSRASSAEKRKSTTKKNNANTCTESSIALDDLYDNGIVVVPPEKTRKRETTRVHEKAFRWEGDAPPQLTAEQMELIREFKEGGRCSLCPRTKGYRGVGRMTNVEQSMLAHFIVNHHEDGDAVAVVTRKRYLLSTSLESGGVETVPPFLLQSVHPRHLTCSRCMSFKCSRQSNLVVHWEVCSGVRGNRWKTTNRREKDETEKEEGEGEEEVEKEEKKTPKRVMNSVRCPLCREGWRKSSHYSDDVSVAIHLLLKHTTDGEAYEMALQLEEETNLQSSFPFIHLTDSFALRAERPSSGIQCALCDTNSPALAPAIRHATRTHANAKEKVDAGFAAGKLSCPLPSLCPSSHLRSLLSGRPRSTIAVHFLHVLLNHGRREKDARKYLKRISEEDATALREETNLRLDVEKSVQSWLSGSARLVCALCSHPSPTLSLHTRHFDEQDCGEAADREGRERKSMFVRGVGAGGRTSMSMPRTPSEMPQSAEKRGRGRAPEAGMACAHCDRVVYASGEYAPSVSMDIHLLKMHPREERTTLSSTFPFIDFSLSTSDSLQCALCSYSAAESRYVIPHAWTKHPEESKEAQGMVAWAEFELSMQRKREKQRVSCSRGMKRMRKEMKMGKGEEEKEQDDEMREEGEREEKRRRVEGEEQEENGQATATAFIRTPRQRSAVSRWLDTSMAGTSTYSPSVTTVDEDLRERLDRLFGATDTPSTSQTAPTHDSSSIFKELPEVYQMRSTGSTSRPSRAEDISHIKGAEGVRCSVCAFKGRDTETLRIHFNEAHQEVSSLTVPDVFPCGACSKVFNNKKKWRCHCEEDHEAKDRPFQCFKCSFRFETHQKLRAHQIRVHESEILVHPDDRTCRECNRLFASLRSFQAHRKRHEERERVEEEEEC